MSKIKHYMVVEGNNPEDLDKRVEMFIEMDWQPFGSLQAVGFPSDKYADRTKLFQAMVKYEDN